jgi:hypothetical protein
MSDREKTPLLVAPEGFVVERDDRALPPADYRMPEMRSVSLRVAWPSGSRATAIPTLLFSVFWFGFLAFWYTTAFYTNATWIMFVFPLLHVGAGCWMLYGALVALMNTTRVSIGSGVVDVRSGPMPVRGNARIEAARIAQLFVTRKERKGQKGGKTTTFAVEAALSGGGRVVVVRSLESADEALYLEALLEEALGITPQPVVGEIAR